MPEQIRTVLCPVNLRHAVQSTRGYDIALREAAHYGARLHVVTVAPEVERNLNIYDSRKYWGEKLKEFLAAHPPGEVASETAVLIGSAHRQIVKYADQKKVDLIVIEAANPRVEDYLLGTTASHVVTHSSASVFVVR